MLLSKTSAPVVFGCSGLALTPEERDFFQEIQPLGFIIFGRNIKEKFQLKALIQDLKSTSQQTEPLILIDQEGGRVARLTAPHWNCPPSVQSLVTTDMAVSKKNIAESYSKIARDLRELGINCNCAPVLDLHIPQADPIMGDRTFHSDPQKVAELGSIVIKTLQEEEIIPIMKHIPGHGAALCDSHKELPVVHLSSQELQSHFIPFKANASCPMAMTAHIVYPAIDPKQPATHSSSLIKQVIREEIGFKGLLITDDIGMSALTGSYAERAERSLEAGCDIVLHCSGNLAEMQDVMRGIN